MSDRLMAIVAEGARGRVYLPPTEAMEALARSASPEWRPNSETHGKCRVNVGLYGLTTWDKLFTPRQLVVLSNFSDLVQEARERVKQDALAAGMADDGLGLEAGGTGGTAYADAVAVYLSFAVDKETESLSTLCTWSASPKNELVVSTFRRQALPMTWDFGEANPFAVSSGSLAKTTEAISKVIGLALTGSVSGGAQQRDAAGSVGLATNDDPAPRIVSTDPPYYDNIGYADLSDFFYVWLRRTLKPVFPGLFATLAVPKADELVATPYRHGSKEAAETFCMDGMARAMHRLAEQAHPAFPVTIYYAFKSSETESEGTASTGWETFLEAVLQAGFSISGTWPMRTERAARSTSIDSNALASSIVLVCRQRDLVATTISRREFLRELNAALPEALLDMTRGGVNSPVAPVDLSQAIIGPGMAIFSKYAAVLEADGTPMRVRTALQLINRFLAEDDFDADTHFCLHWFETHGWSEGRFGEADVLARAKGTSVGGVAESGVLASGRGIVRLLRYAEYPADWSPEHDPRTSVWEALHYLIRALQSGGESASGALLTKMPARTEAIRQLAYRLYTLCERKGWAEEARAYNELITSWEAIEIASHTVERVEKQIELKF
jgi:putative DNA methylase